MAVVFVALAWVVLSIALIALWVSCRTLFARRSLDEPEAVPLAAQRRPAGRR